MRTIRTISLTLLCVAGSASPAGAANPIEGLWSYGKGLVEVTPGGGEGVFKGVVMRKFAFSTCDHPEGERMWRIVDELDGTYHGTHVNYKSDCSPDPGAPAIWRVLQRANDRDVLQFCANDPGDPPPTEFEGPGCRGLFRAAPARDVAQICSSGYVRASVAQNSTDLCLVGPRELRRTGCLRRSRQVLHRFEVKLRDTGRATVPAGAKIKSVKFRHRGRTKGTDRRAPFRLALSGSEIKRRAQSVSADVLLTGADSARERRKLTLDFDGCK